ncbi:MAG: hypothetical protein L0Z62_35755 [Gemmataceae bacterium]|nr:hypothetical protein [Gemmataceae bacterium]
MKSAWWGYPLVALLLTAVGCGTGNTPDSSQGKEKISDEKALTVKEYVNQGVPVVEKPWSSADFSEAVKALIAIAQRKPQQLPRYKGSRSGDVFSQLTSEHYLEAIKDRKTPIEDRFQQLIALLKSSNQIYLTYLNALSAGTALDEEAVELSGAQLRLTATFIIFMDEMIPTLNKNNPEHQVRIKGYANMGEHLADIVNGATMILGEKREYRATARARLITYERKTFPVIVPRLPADAKKQVVTRLESLSEDEAYADLQPGLRELLEEVRVLTKNKKEP